MGDHSAGGPPWGLLIGLGLLAALLIGGAIWAAVAR